MKRISIFLLFIFLSASTLQAQWRELHTGVTENLYDVCCVDTNTVFVCGQNGVILKTVDGGDTWQELYRQEGRELCKIAFANQNVGYAGGNDGADNGVLMRTTDGGETWEDVNNTIVFDNDYQSLVDNFNTNHPNNDIYDNIFSCRTNLCAFSSDTIFIFQQNDLFRSVDGGESFTQQTFTEGKINGVFIDGDYGCLVLYDNLIVKVKTSSDAGVTWEEKTEFGFTGGGFILYDYECEHDKDVVVKFVDKEKIKIVGNYSIAETFDGFETIEYTSISNPFDIANTSVLGPFDMKFSSENNGCYIYNNEPDKGYKEGKYNPYIYSGTFITWDGGVSWAYQEEMFRHYHYYYSVAAVDSMFYVTTENGTVYHYSPHNIQGVNEEAKDAYSFTVSPVPAKDYIIINYNHPTDHVTLKITNNLGVTIKTIKVEGKIGKKLVSLSDIAAGVYSCTLQSEGFVRMEKIVVTK